MRRGNVVLEVLTYEDDNEDFSETGDLSALNIVHTPYRVRVGEALVLVHGYFAFSLLCGSFIGSLDANSGARVHKPATSLLASIQPVAYPMCPRRDGHTRGCHAQGDTPSVPRAATGLESNKCCVFLHECCHCGMVEVGVAMGRRSPEELKDLDRMGGADMDLDGIQSSIYLQISDFRNRTRAARFVDK